MNRRNDNRKNKTQVWISVGAVILIILLIAWLTIADLTGDTDVNAVTTLVGMLR